MAERLPAIQFYPGDWLQDSVAGCSLAAQGLWLRMLFVAHRSDRYGLLNHGDNPLPWPDLARRCGTTVEEMMPLIEELRKAGVFSEENGIIFSRRLVRDNRLRQIRRDSGRKGGNPILLNQNPTTRVNQNTEDEDEDSRVSYIKGGMQGGEPPIFTPTPPHAVAAILAAYPRQEAINPARQAVEYAITDIRNRPSPPPDPSAWLLARVKLFAKSRAGQAGRMVPLPRRWFEDERFNDDEKSWERGDPDEAAPVAKISPLTGKPMPERMYK